jgi:hypothetical protein
MQEIACSIPCGCILLSIPAQSLWIPHRIHKDSTRTYWLLQFDQVQSPVIIHSIWVLVDSMRSGVEWSTLEKDWRWTEGGIMWSAGGLHGLHGDWRWTPRGSVGECNIQQTVPKRVRSLPLLDRLMPMLWKTYKIFSMHWQTGSHHQQILISAHLAQVDPPTLTPTHPILPLTITIDYNSTVLDTLI